MKKSKITKIAVDRLAVNEGQLDWLPRNPRQWTQTDIDRMVKSMEEDPDFAEERPVLAVPGPDKTFVVFCHNLLTRAAQVKGEKQLPAVIYEPETDEDKQTILRRALKDNGSFGSWDTDILADEWDFETFELEDFGLPGFVTGRHEGSVDIDGLFDPNKEAPAKPKPTIIEVSVPLGMEDKIEDIRAALLVTLEPFPGVTIS